MRPFPFLLPVATVHSLPLIVQNRDDDAHGQPNEAAMTFVLGMVAGILIVLGLIFAVWAFSEPIGPKF